MRLSRLPLSLPVSFHCCSYVFVFYFSWFSRSSGLHTVTTTVTIKVKKYLALFYVRNNFRQADPSQARLHRLLRLFQRPFQRHLYLAAHRTALLLFVFVYGDSF